MATMILQHYATATMSLSQSSRKAINILFNRRVTPFCRRHYRPTAALENSRRLLTTTRRHPSSLSAAAAAAAVTTTTKFKSCHLRYPTGRHHQSIITLRSRIHTTSSILANNSANNTSSHPTSTISSSHDSSSSSLKFDHPACNITPNIASKIGTNLHLRPHHPLNIIKTIIEQYWNNSSSPSSSSKFLIHDNLPPTVSTHQNFDSLLIPPTHPSRSPSDTYYLDPETVLRTHTSAHQYDLLRRGEERFLVTGDVYRRDEIDRSHYPVFHQMEGVKMFDFGDGDGEGLTGEEMDEVVVEDLKRGLEGMARALFGDVKMRWIDAYFPFTSPSFELEIFFNDEWLEVLGCGVVHKQIIQNLVENDDYSEKRQHGWAFGLGLERLAMILFSIPDIRLFWTTDERFTSQFKEGQIVTFEPYSKYPPCFKDVSFWLPTDEKNQQQQQQQQHSCDHHANDVHEVVRDVVGDLAEQVQLLDEFVHPKTKRVSRCWRVTYRSMDRSLTNEEVDALQERLRGELRDRLGVQLR